MKHLSDRYTPFSAPDRSNRQLNLYGFKKVAVPKQIIYYHKYFKRGQPGLLELIQRRQNMRRKKKKKNNKIKTKKIKKKDKVVKKKTLMAYKSEVRGQAESSVDEQEQLEQLTVNINDLKFRLMGLEKRVYNKIIENNKIIQDQSFMMSHIFKMRKENEERLETLWKMLMILIKKNKTCPRSLLHSSRLGHDLGFPAISNRPFNPETTPLASRNDQIIDYSLSKLETIQSASVSKKLKEENPQSPETLEDVDNKYTGLLDDPEDLELSEEKGEMPPNNSVIAKVGSQHESMSMDTNQENRSIFDTLPREMTKIISEVPPPLPARRNQLAIVPKKKDEPKVLQIKKRKFSSSLFDGGRFSQERQGALPVQKEPVRSIQHKLRGIQGLGKTSNQNVDLILQELFKIFKKQNVQISREHFIRNLIEQGLSFYFCKRPDNRRPAADVQRELDRSDQVLERPRAANPEFFEKNHAQFADPAGQTVLPVEVQTRKREYGVQPGRDRQARQLRPDEPEPAVPERDRAIHAEFQLFHQSRGQLLQVPEVSERAQEYDPKRANGHRGAGAGSARDGESSALVFPRGCPKQAVEQL